MPETPSLDALIETLNAQRATLGDAAVDHALAALRAARPAPAPAPVPRLRQVSVLFCDIVDSTSLLRQRGAEDAAELVGAALQRFAAVVVAGGGKVLRYTGDGLKAVFGGDATREDDAERAVHAGLALLAAARDHAAALGPDDGVGFAVRVGINTGPVLLGAGAEADRAAMGHAVHIAARLEQSAPAGRLRIARDTWVHVRGRFEVEAQPALSVKGSDEPLQTYLVVASRPRAGDEAGRRGVDGVRPALIGRADELARLEAVVAAAGSERRLHASVLLGDAGLGKSRLLHELQRRLGGGAADGVADDVAAGTDEAAPDAGATPAAPAVLLARAQPSSLLQPYGLLRDLLTRWLGIADDAPAEVARGRLVAGLAPFFAGPAAGEAAAHRIGTLVGLDFPASPHLRGLQGRELREAAFRALAEALQALAAARPPGGAPLLVLLDDLHWADDGSLAFVARLVEAAPAVPIALLTAARPALLDRLADGSDALAALAAAPRRLLAPLSAGDGAALAGALLARLPAGAAPQRLRRLLVERADGNPFFMEELVRMLIDDGVIDAAGTPWTLRAGRLDRLRVPDTLVGVLQARLDALPEVERTALQQASIVGPVFWAAALAAVDPAAPAALAALQRRGLVRPRPASTFEQAGEHAFAHALLHEVTYATVLKAARRDGHARAARWLLDRVGGRAPEFVAIAGEHWERAGDSARALDCYERASRDALWRFAHGAARAYTERALAQPALAADPLHRFWLLNRSHLIADHEGAVDRGRQAIAAMAAHAEACDDDAMRARVLAVQAIRADRAGAPVDAVALAARALVLADRSASPQAATAACPAHSQLAWTALTERRFDAVDAHLAAALPWARRCAALPPDRGGHAGYEMQLQAIGIESLMLRNRFAEARAALVPAQALVEAGGTGLDRYSLLVRQAVIAANLGELDGAERGATRALALARELGVPRHRAGALCTLAEIAELRGDATRQLDFAQQAGAAGEAAAFGRMAALALALQGSALQALGDVDEGRRRLEQALRRHGDDQRHDEASAVRARLADGELRHGTPAAALAHVDAWFAAPGAAAALAETRWRCWRVLRHAGDARAAPLHRLLHDELQALLAQLPDDAARRRLLAALPHWREVGLVAPAGDGPAA